MGERGGKQRLLLEVGGGGGTMDGGPDRRMQNSPDSLVTCKDVCRLKWQIRRLVSARLEISAGRRFETF